MKASFWTYFTSGYGIFWLFLMFVSLVFQIHIDTGLFGLIGFPVIALIYALVRTSGGSAGDSVDASRCLRPKMDEFLRAHPQYKHVSPGRREEAFDEWMKTSSS